MIVHKRSVGIIGVGNVGIAGAYALLLRNQCDEIILVDKDKERAHGEALDLMHSQSLVGKMAIKPGEIEDLKACQIIVITAGVPQKIGETRLDLLENNSRLFSYFAKELDKYAPKALVIIVSNPVDILTQLFQQFSNRPPSKVIGSGTILDSARLHALISQRCDVDPKSVSGYVLGEHGDSEVIAWSTVSIGGASVTNSNTSKWKEKLCETARDEIAHAVIHSAYEIIKCKGYTNLAIGAVIAHLVGVIFSDGKTILPVSSRLQGEYGIKDVVMSIPSLVGSSGIEEVMDLPLIDNEIERLQHSAEIMRSQLLTVC